MHSAVKYLVSASIIVAPYIVHGEESLPAQAEASLPAKEAPFEAFTGKVTRNKVRLRLQPNLDGTIIREFQKGELLIVMGEKDEFYIVKAPEDLKSYVFRTFILDNTVEGKHVNVRLQPDLEAPIIAQLNSGDHVEGTISPLNNKWLEIAPPANARFYICKEYVEMIGPSHMMATLQRRREEVNTLLASAFQISQEQLQKPYEQIQSQFPKTLDLFEKILVEYTDFPEQSARAKDLLSEFQDAYLQKKVAYLEAKARLSEELKNKQIAAENQPKIAAARASPAEQVAAPSASPVASQDPVDGKVAIWIPIETALYEAWAKNHAGGTMEQFYEFQKNNGVVLTGIIEPYIRNVRNKPGDYVLHAKNNRIPNAYLYSTKVDLSSKLGQEVTIIALPRSNNDFALPAYFVISIE